MAELQQGISLLDPRTDQVITFDTTHGLQSNELNFGAYHANTDGEMFFGGNNGFNAFHPARVGTNRHVPPKAGMPGKANEKQEEENR